LKLNDLTFHPILFGLFPIISLFESSMSFTSVTEVILPTILIIGIITPSWIILKKIKNGQKSALIISVILILFFTYGPIYLAVDNFTIGEYDVGRHSYLLILFTGIFILSMAFLIKTNKNLKNLSSVANIFSLVITSVILANIVIYTFENNYSISIENYEFETNNKKIQEMPDIYFIILDGYPGQKSLQLVNNYDNEYFLNDLKKYGFFIQEKSFANYPHTFLSIPSMLNMKYLNYLSETLKTKNDQTIPHIMGSDNQVMNFVKSQGYVTVSFDSGWGFTRDMKSADLKLCGDNKIFNSEFMISWIKNSMLNIIYVKIFETDKIEQRLCIFEELPRITERTNEPVFVFAHVFSPHPPYIFGPNGEIRQLKNLDPNLETNENLDKTAFIGQLKFINKKIIETVEKLLDSEKQPVIIIQSDHGTAFLFEGDLKNWDTPTDEMIQERMDTITFIFLPNNTENIFAKNVTPVNLFRILFNHYMGTDFKVLGDKMYFAKDQSYDFLNVTKILKEP
jgi:hypothetical protein